MHYHVLNPVHEGGAQSVFNSIEEAEKGALRFLGHGYIWLYSCTDERLYRSALCPARKMTRIREIPRCDCKPYLRCARIRIDEERSRRGRR